MKMITPSNDGPNFPSHPSVNLDQHPYGPSLLVLAQRHAVVRRHRHVGPGNEGRPNVDVLVALVRRRYGGVVGDLLAPVGGVGVEFVVVDSDSSVGVSGGDGDLKVGGNEIGKGGEVEGVKGGVLEGKTRFFGLENGPYDEDCEEDDEEDDEDTGEEAADELFALIFVVGALFSCHDAFLGKMRDD